jgi:L-threonylcarbamoyladenylate synthase
VFPTWCLYGIGVDALNIKAVNNLFTIKQRDPAKPLLILIKNKEILGKYVKTISPVAKKIIQQYWPGKVTLIFEASDIIPDALTAGTGKIGIRLPEHPIARQLAARCKNPITGTSANISGTTGCSDIQYLDKKISETVDIILNAGPLKGGTGSTIVDTTQNRAIVLREGEIKSNEILNLCQ